MKGNWENNASFDSGKGQVQFSGNSKQSIFSGGDYFADVLFDNITLGSNDIELLDNMQIEGEAIFNNGIVNLNSFNLNFGDTASSVVSTDESFVNGIVTKTGQSAFVFPVGEVGEEDGVPYAVCGPVGIDAPSTPSNISAEYFFAKPPFNNWKEGMCDLEEMHNASGVEYWMLNSDGDHPDVTLYWLDGDRSGIIDASKLVVAHYDDDVNQDCWNNKGGSIVFADEVPVAVKSEIPFLSYSPITFGTITHINPLPVELIEFVAECDSDNSVKIEWITATEINNDYFVLERSFNTKDWIKIDKLAGAGNSNTSQVYNIEDNNINGTVYYRLLQVDYDGQNSYSKTIQTNCYNWNVEPRISVYPNPFNNLIKLNLYDFEEECANIEIVDLFGQVLINSEVNLQGNETSLDLFLGDLPPAVYILRVKTSSGFIIKRIEKL
ncbi:MAG: T9SS type A sorting domain-containing protein [Bacteroidales bacterium]|nr:T9SS type A sorting domain-containing protein [Bacteroidales bacterium]